MPGRLRHLATREVGQSPNGRFQSRRGAFDRCLTHLANGSPDNVLPLRVLAEMPHAEGQRMRTPSRMLHQTIAVATKPGVLGTTDGRIWQSHWWEVNVRTND